MTRTKILSEQNGMKNHSINLKRGRSHNTSKTSFTKLLYFSDAIDLIVAEPHFRIKISKITVTCNDNGTSIVTTLTKKKNTFKHMLEKVAILILKDVFDKKLKND